MSEKGKAPRALSVEKRSTQANMPVSLSTMRSRKAEGNREAKSRECDDSSDRLSSGTVI